MPSTTWTLKSAGFLAVPTKTTVLTDWSPQIKSSLAALEENPASFTGEMEALTKLRTDVLGAEANPAGLAILNRYYQQLEALTVRFPTLQKPQNIQFEWSDAFDQSQKAKQSSLAFEKANVAFNMASFFSRIGSTKQRSAENYSIIAQNFQAAASIFSWMSETFLHPPLVDMRPTSLHFLSELMLAQAQECSLLKASQEGKSSAILAKLSAALYKRYERCNAFLESPESAEFRETLSSACKSMVYGKEAFYKILTQIYGAEAATTAKKYGEALGRLTAAEELLKQLLSDSSLVELFKPEELSEYLAGRREKWEHENNFIYHEAVVEECRLLEIEAFDVTKTVSFKEALAGMKVAGLVPGKELFRSVLPQKALQDLSNYSEETAKLLRYESSKCEEADDDLEIRIVQANTIGSAQTIGSAHFSLEDLTGLFEGKKSKAKLGKDLLDRIRLLLAEDKARMVQNISKYGNSWTMSALENAYSSQLESMSRQIEKATIDISALSKMYEQELKAPLRKLMSGSSTVQPRQLSSLIDEAPVNVAKESSELLHKMKQLGALRQSYLTELRQKILADDISDKVIVHTDDPDALFEAEMRKFDGLCLAIEENVEAHKGLVAQLEDLLGGEERRVEAERASSGIVQAEEEFARLEELQAQIVHQIQSIGEVDVGQLFDKVAQEVAVRADEAIALARSLESNPAFQTQQLLRAKLAALGLSSSSDAPSQMQEERTGQSTQPGSLPNSKPSLLDL